MEVLTALLQHQLMLKETNNSKYLGDIDEQNTPTVKIKYPIKSIFSLP